MTAPLLSVEDVVRHRDAVLDRMLTRMVAEIPHYATLDRSGLDSVRTITAAYVEGCLQAAQERRGPSPSELSRMAESARLRARQGWPLSALLHGYRVAVGAWWDIVRSEIEQQPRDLTAVVELAAALLRYSDEAQSVVAESWSDEAELLAADEDRRHHRLMQSLMSGPRADASGPAERAGVELAGSYAVVLILDPGNSRAHPRIAKALRALHLQPQVLAAPRPHDVLALWPQSATVRIEIERAIECMPGGSRLAVAVADPEVTHGYAAALDEAAQVLAVTGRRRPGVHRLDDVPLQALVRQAGGRITEIVGGLLDPVREEDELRASDLLTTLRAYVDADASTRQAAAALHVHPNTVSYRLERVRALTGHDPRSLRDAVLLVAALELHECS